MRTPITLNKFNFQYCYQANYIIPVMATYLCDKVRKFKWKGHVVLTGERRGTYIDSVGKPYVNERHGRFRCS